MSRTIVVPIRRHQKTALDRLLTRVAPECRPFAAQLLCIRTHQHDRGGCLPAPRGYWPQVIPDGCDQ